MKVGIASQSWGHKETSMYTHSRDVMEAARSVGIDANPMPLKSYRGAKHGGLLYPLVQRVFASYPRQDGEIVHHIDQDALRGVDVVTIHDLGVFRGALLDNEFANRFFRHAIRTAVRRAKRVIVTTNGTKTGLESIIPGSSDKVRVVPVPHKPVTTERIPKRYDAIWVGRNAPNKRVMDYLELADRYPDKRFALRCSRSPGRPEIDNDFEFALKALPNVTRITGPLTDDELDRLYRSTKVYVATSRLEGFHRPPLEHYLRGGKVVCPEIEPYTEIYPENAVHFFDPNHPGDIDRAFEEALKEPGRSPDHRVIEMVSFTGVGEKLRGVYEEASRR